MTRATRRIVALPRLAARGALRLSAPLLQPLDRRLGKRALARNPRRHAPIFIIGAPRSGSTLLYKLMVDSLGLAYFDGLSAWLSSTPLLAATLSQRLGLAPVSGYENRYGTMAGWGSPHECGPYWYRWFSRGENVYAASGALTATSREQLRNEVFALGAFHDRPMLFKNLFNTMRTGALAECFPEASFIVCRRDPLHNALSLLRGRIERGHDKNAWWTVPPREAPSLRQRPYPEQVAGQVFYLERQIATDVAQHDAARFLQVPYERLCENVHEEIRGIARFLGSRGHALRPNLAGVPETFALRRPVGIDAADEEAVGAAVRAFYGGVTDV